MKATCPKCGKTLHIWNWKQDCPSCGVNMIGYDLQSRLLRDADQAEAEFARIQPYFDRAKAAYAGSIRTIIRLICSILPFPALLLPLAYVSGTRMNIVGVIQWIADVFKDGGAFAVDGTPLPDRTLFAALVPAALLVWTILLLFAHLGFIAGSCSRPGRLRLFDLDARMLLSTLAAGAVLHLFFRMLSAAVPTVGTCAVGWGGYVFLLLLAVLTSFDLALARTGIPVKYKTCYIRGIPAEDFFAAQEQADAPCA